MTKELGAPLKVSEEVHYKMGYEHFSKAAEALKSYTFTEDRGGHTIIKRGDWCQWIDYTVELPDESDIS